MIVNDWKQIFVGFILASWILVSYYSANVNNNDGAFVSNDLGWRRPKPVYIQEEDERSVQNVQDTKPFNASAAKSILYFTSYFDMTDFEFGFGNEPFHRYGCPETNCWTTADRDALDSIADFDAVLFHMRDLGANPLRVPNQKKRRPHQRYVMFLMESPVNDQFPYDKVKSFFNWTMTYRPDSDVPRPYGYVEPIEAPFEYPPRTSPSEWRAVNKTAVKHGAIKSKDKMVAWIVSNCKTDSQREVYVRELQKHIQVDVMGGCGDIKCDTKNHRAFTDSCTQAVEERYKFYLSFENSICDHYATEKFFKRLSLTTVPVVMGGSDYAKLAPPQSYINIDDFADPKALADFLLELDRDPERYLAYFWWKDFYRSRMDREQKAKSMCLLCAKLNDPKEPVKVYEDLGSWWREGSHCRRKGQHAWSKFTGKGNLIDEFMERVMGTAGR